MKSRLLLGILFCTLLAINASAHLSSGEDKEVDGFLIDFGNDPSVLIEDEPAFIAMTIINQSASSVPDVHSVWLRISSGDTIHFASTLEPQLGGVQLAYTFPEAGHYEITARFSSETTRLAQATFTVDVEAEGIPGGTVSLILLGIAILIAVLFLVPKKRS